MHLQHLTKKDSETWHGYDSKSERMSIAQGLTKIVIVRLTGS